MAAALAMGLAFAIPAMEAPAVSDPTKTTYGEISPDAPEELRVFAFLIGKWEGKGRTRTGDGSVAEYPITWIGRYILGGTVIADEAHGPGPEGKPYMGITFRQYVPARRGWTIEFLNVNGSFLRRQVNAGDGAVEVSGRNVTVSSSGPGMLIREHYLVPDDGHWSYRLDLSTDGGRSWDRGQVEMDFTRVE